jgi:peroxiredoxin
MALTESTMLPLGTIAPSFRLRDVISDNMISLDDFRHCKAYVIMFICNHCPYVVHINSELVKFAKEYLQKEICFIAISSNDIEKYPMDGPEEMKRHAMMQGYPFPYLYDETQEVAKAYDAACTPDFYVFDEDKKLVYRGRFDDSRPNSGVRLTGKDLRKALDALLNRTEVSPQQFPSMGCNIKWKSI